MNKGSGIPIVILTSRSTINAALIDELSCDHSVKGVVFEDQRALRTRLFKARLKKLGPLTVLDQLAYKLIDTLLFRKRSDRRAQNLCSNENSFDPTAADGTEIVDTDSVNSHEVTELVRRVKPAVVVVSGTSLLSEWLLKALEGIPVINIHCGICPRYRGAHGAFWAIVNRDWDNVGTTVHFVDTGVDTGDIILQAAVEPEGDDTPRDLALKQYEVGIPLLSEAITRIASGTAETVRRDDLDSRFYSSPTLSAYLRYRKQMRKRFRTHQ